VYSEAGRYLIMLRTAVRYFRAHHLAFLALFFALGGTSYAAVAIPRNAVGTAQLRNGAVTLPKISRAALASLAATNRGKGDPGAPGPAGPPGATGARGAVGADGSPGSNGTNATALFAVVNASGTALAGSGVIGVTHLATGTYDVTFNRDVSGCAFSATVGARNGGVAGDPEISANAASGPTPDVVVATFNGSTPNDRSFNVSVFC
jgi:hypothetical protein